MTQPAPNNRRIIELPPLKYPVVTRVVSDPLFPADQGHGVSPSPGVEPVVWLLGANHPFSGAKIVRIHFDDLAVEIYAVSGGGVPTRNVIPMSRVRLLEEEMPVETFIEEMAAADDDTDPDDDEPDDDDDNEPSDSPDEPAIEDRPTPPPPIPNGSS